MCCQEFKNFFDNYGEILSAVVGSLLSVIVSFINWIFFLIQLSGNGSVNLNSLVIVTIKKDQQFFIAIGDIKTNNNNCLIFFNDSEAKSALSNLSYGVYAFSRILGIIWAVIQIIFILEMALDVILKLSKSRESLTRNEFYFGYFKFIITALSNSILIFINKVDFDSQCLVDYPWLLGTDVSPIVPFVFGLIFLGLCIVGYSFCWYNNDNPNFSLTYGVQLLIFWCPCSNDEGKKQEMKNDLIKFHLFCYGILVIFCFFLTIAQNIPFLITTLITIIIEAIDKTKKYNMLKKNNFEPVELQSKSQTKNTGAAYDPESQPSKTSTQN